MSAIVDVAPCRGCGTPKRIDTECSATAECIEHNRIRREEEQAFWDRITEAQSRAISTTGQLVSARGIQPESWVATDQRPDIAAFRVGYDYAATQTMAIDALSAVSAEDLYYAWSAINRGIERSGGVGEPGTNE